jgi:hypothetical protein
MVMEGAGQTTVGPSGGGTPAQVVPMELSSTMAIAQRVMSMYDDGSAMIEMDISGMQTLVEAKVGGQPIKTQVKIAGDKITVTGAGGSHEMGLSDAGTGAAGEPMRMRLSPRGEILMENTEALNEISKLAGTDVSKMMTVHQTSFPEDEVSVGDNWEYDIHFPVPGTDRGGSAQMEARVVEIADGGRMVRVASAGKVDMSGVTMKTSEPGQPAVDLSFDRFLQDIDGSFTFDVGRGVMTDATYDMVLDMLMDAPSGTGAGTARIGMEMDLKLTMAMK